MTRHSASFEVDRPLPPDAVEGLLQQPSSDPAQPAQGEAAHNKSDASLAAAPPSQTGRLRRLLMAGAAVAVLAGAAWYGFDYWTFGRFQVSTDDAYVKADNTTIAPKVSGYLREVQVGDNERVTAGQVLARIDERDFKVALDQAKADVEAAQAAIVSKQAQLDAQQAVIDAARATIDVDQANVTFADQENKRYSDLAKTGFGSVQNAQQAASRIAGANATLQRDTANLASALKQVDLLKADINQAKASLAKAQAAQEQAELNLSYTTIVAPIDGVVGNRTLRVGQYVTAGTQLMSLVPADGAYIVANYKETQLTDVKKGQAVAIEVDMFPGQTVHGHVDSIAPASGQEFALLPPDNATGNFTKVVQRIPVKITLNHDNPQIALRPGMSVIPTIDTLTPAPTAVGAAKAPSSNMSSKVSDGKISEGSCHVKSRPVRLDRTADLWQNI